MDEHVWRHTPYGDKYVTVVLDLTPIRDRRGPSRLLDMVPGRSKKVFKTWLASQPDTWRERIEIVAMDGFTGFKSAAAEELPGATMVMDPFHVVHLAGNALDECRRRIQQELHHRRGRATDPLYKARRMLIRQILPTHRASAAPDTRPVFQRRARRTRGHLERLPEHHRRLPLIQRAWGKDFDARGNHAPHLHRHALLPHRAHHLGQDTQTPSRGILAYFDHPHTSNGPTEAINGRLEHLRGSALGFRNLTHYITRALLETGGFKPQLHPQL